MFKIKRIAEDRENRISLNVPEGGFEIVGTSPFVVELFRAICENDYFVEILRKTFAGESVESVAQKMREAGFPEQIVVDFENGDIWADVIKTDYENGR